MYKILSLIFLTSLFTTVLSSQIVTTDPPFPTVEDDITIYYDATQGSAGLVDVDQVYIHTGIITVAGGPGGWMNVQGNWGTDDPNVKMTNEGDNIHSISFNVTDYYGIEPSDEVVELGMVFRNVDGSKEGKTSDFGDIYTPIYSANSELLGKFVSPGLDNFVLAEDEDLLVSLAFSKEVTFELFDNDESILSATGKVGEITLEDLSEGSHDIRYEATNGSETISDSFHFVVNKPNEVADDPDDLPYGANIISDDVVRLKLYAPLKEHVYVLGDFNDWSLEEGGQMKQSQDGSYYWIDIDGLSDMDGVAYSYLVDGTIHIGDPYSKLILDDWHDPWVSSTKFPDLPVYPEKAVGLITYLDLTPTPFVWADDDFEPVPQSRMNIYELLVRDFLEDRSYNSLIDSLSYLKEMGINTLQLMPVQEFEGNQSWGYNPSFHMALDKYYGDPVTFKKLVNTAHEMDIAVIIDVVYNHAFGQNPYVRLYWENGKPSPESPFFNVDATHPFNVGFDFNHESEATNHYVKQTSEYWLDEFHIDGFRFDLSKGFTQKLSTDDGVMRAYDQNRIDILSEYAEHLWEINNDFVVILEHFAANNEEKVLANKGMMLWTNANHAFNEGTMGYNESGKSNFAFLSYKNKGWNDPHAVGYMESHDEERLQYKNLEFGNSNGSYSTQDLETSFDRLELATAFLFSIPGPKMIWQMGELAFDYSINWCTNGTINNDCRLTPKPVRWDYLEEEGRADLLKVYQAMMHLRATEEVMHTDDFVTDVGGKTKRIRLNSDEDNVFLMGNFEVTAQSIPTSFQHDGWWYDYFTGDSIFVDESLTSIDFEPGEYRMYWDKKVDNPAIVTDVEKYESLSFKIYPNPSQHGTIVINHELDKAQLEIYNLSGQRVFFKDTFDPWTEIQHNLQAGMYIVRVSNGQQFATRKLVVN